jgi:hypothetical protein
MKRIVSLFDGGKPRLAAVETRAQANT